MATGFQAPCRVNRPLGFSGDRTCRSETGRVLGSQHDWSSHFGVRLVGKGGNCLVQSQSH